MKYWLTVCTVALAPMSVGAASYPAADLNGYISQHDEPVIAAGDRCAEGRTCHVEPPSCDQIIKPTTSPTGDWSAINWSNDVICIQKGDHRGRGSLDVRFSGTASEKKWIVYYDGGSIDSQTHPYTRPTSEKARIHSIRLTDRSHVIVAGLTVEPSREHGIRISGDGSHILDKIELDGSDIHGSGGWNAISLKGSTRNNVIQNSAIGPCTEVTDADVAAISISGGVDGTKIVNNELFDCTDGVILGSESSTIDDTIIENNDIYFTPAKYVDCSDTRDPFTKDPDGKCMCAENGIDWKGPPSRASRNGKVVHNRFWGSRTPVLECGGSGDKRGAMLQPNEQVDYLLIERNIFTDFQTGLFASGGSGRAENNITVRANLFHDWAEYETASGQRAPAIRFGNASDWWLVSFNTFANGSDTPDTHYLERNGDSRFVCNLMVNARGTYGSWTGGDFAERESGNVMAGDSNGLDGARNGSYGLNEARLDSYSYSRRLITGPERVTVSNAKPTTDSPFVNACSGYSKVSGYGIE